MKNCVCSQMERSVGSNFHQNMKKSSSKKLFFPNRSLLLRVLMAHQRGVSEKTHTKRAATSVATWPAAAPAVWKFVGFYHQSQISSRVFRNGKICNGKNKGLALLDPFSYCFKMTLQKNVLLIDLRLCFHFYFSLLLQKTFLLIDLRPMNRMK